MNSDATGIRGRLFLAREQAKLTQAEVAQELDVSRQMVSRWESGASSPTLEQFADLCALYGVTCYFILRGTAESAAAIFGRAMREAASKEVAVKPGRSA
jgi:transcriptional regulator with XRE-family HTH domain